MNNQGKSALAHRCWKSALSYNDRRRLLGALAELDPRLALCHELTIVPILRGHALPNI